MDTSDALFQLNPQITDITIGIRNLRTIKIFPLSVADQLQATDLVTSALQTFMMNKDGMADLAFVAFLLEQVKTNASEILKMVLDTDENAKEVLKEITNDQMMLIVQTIYKVNYEALSKNVKSLLEKNKKESLSERQSPQSVSSTITNLNTSLESRGEMVE